MFQRLYGVLNTSHHRFKCPFPQILEDRQHKQNSRLEDKGRVPGIVCGKNGRESRRWRDPGSENRPAVSGNGIAKIQAGAGKSEFNSGNSFCEQFEMTNCRCRKIHFARPDQFIGELFSVAADGENPSGNDRRISAMPENGAANIGNQPAENHFLSCGT